MFYLFGN